jgi:hypothetical protein
MENEGMKEGRKEGTYTFEGERFWGAAATPDVDANGDHAGGATRRTTPKGGAVGACALESELITADAGGAEGR